MTFSDSLMDVMAGYIVDAVNENLGTESLLKFYDGTMPAETTDPDDGTLILTLPMAATPFAWDDDPQRMTVDTSVMGANVAADGTMQYWRLKNVTNATVMQGTCGDGGTDEINWSESTVTTGQFAFITEWIIDINITP